MPVEEILTRPSKFRKCLPSSTNDFTTWTPLQATEALWPRGVPREPPPLPPSPVPTSRLKPVPVKLPDFGKAKDLTEAPPWLHRQDWRLRATSQSRQALEINSSRTVKRLQPQGEVFKDESLEIAEYVESKTALIELERQAAKESALASAKLARDEDKTIRSLQGSWQKGQVKEERIASFSPVDLDMKISTENFK